MEARIEKGKLILELPMYPEPQPTKSSGGKNLMIAGTGGFTSTAVLHKGKPVKVSVNAIITA